MAYEKNTWATGDVITADLLNHIEQGIFDAHSVISKMYYILITVGYDSELEENINIVETDIPGVTSPETLNEALNNLIDFENTAFVRVFYKDLIYPQLCSQFVSLPARAPDSDTSCRLQSGSNDYLSCGINSLGQRSYTYRFGSNAQSYYDYQFVNTSTT